MNHNGGRQLKERTMERKFYPMITQTVNDLFATSKKDWEKMTEILLKYPDIKNIKRTSILDLLVRELDRQYRRWESGIKAGGK